MNRGIIEKVNRLALVEVVTFFHASEELFQEIFEVVLIIVAFLDGQQLEPV